MRRRKITRRDFFKSAAVTGAGVWVVGSPGCAELKPLPKPRYVSPNEKLNVACVGIGGKGSSDTSGNRSENVVALCDVDWDRGAGSIKRFRKAKKYHDYRKMFDEMHKEIDAVTVSTPDHMHAAVSIRAMRYGMHVFCQKPLTHDVYEARLMAETAAKYKVATQMGNQGTSSEGLRRGVEAIRAGAIGQIREAHVWTNRPSWPQGMARPKGTDPVPPNLKWDLFLGTAPERPYLHQYKPPQKGPVYHPFAWRGWWDFGTGALGDMGCHTANMAFMALNLGSPTSAVAECSGFERDSFPTWSVIRLAFPARGDLPPVKWAWYDGGSDKPPKVIKKLTSLLHGEKLSGSGSLLIGEKGSMYSPHDYGADWSLLPKKDFEGWQAPPRRLPRSPGHHREWLRACKDPKKPAMSNFAYAGSLTETLLLGNIAMYVGKKIEWDGKNCRVTNSPEANALVRREYRKGWEL